MRIAIFDVSNGSCALAVCNNGYSIMLDCGCHSDKKCPLDRISELSQGQGWFSHMKPWVDAWGNTYPLTKLVISHPDLDHLKNIEKVHKKYTPYLLHRRFIEAYPKSAVDQDDENYKYYRDKVCATYRSSVPHPNWGFTEKSYSIPMDVLKTNSLFGESKLKNNSSIVYLLQHGGFRILFGGDLEEAGWDWLIENNQDGFRDDLKFGLDVLVASHHGHSSGYSRKLMDLIGAPKLTILSKGSETGSETDVDSRYSAISKGLSVTGVSGKVFCTKYTLTTRTNGGIYIAVDNSGTPSVWADSI